MKKTTKILYRLAGIVGGRRMNTIVEPLQRLHYFLKYGDYWFARGISVEVSTECNRSCIYCPQSLEKFPAQTMTDEVFDLVCFRLKELDWRGSVTLSLYNEPLMLGQKIVEFSRKVYAAVPKALQIIQTNGDYLTAPLAQQLIDAGVVTFIVTEHPPFNKNWYKRLEPIAKAFPYHIKLQRLKDWEMVNRSGTVNVVPARPEGRCIIPSINISVQIDGRIGHCTQDYYRRRIIGDLRKQSFKDIWFQSEYQEVIRSLRRGIKTHEICRSCSGLEC